jgi:hypothetical protein
MAAGGATPEYMAATFAASCTSNEMGVCDFVVQNLKTFRGPNILIFIALALIVMPQGIIMDTDSAFNDMEIFLLRICSTHGSIHSFDRHCTVWLVQVGYYLRVFFLPAYLVMTVACVTMTNPASAMNFLLNTSAVLFVNAIDDMAGAMWIDKAGQALVRESFRRLETEGGTIHDEAHTFSFQLSSTMTGPMGSPGGAGSGFKPRSLKVEPVWFASLAQSWTSGRIYVFTICVYLIVYVLVLDGIGLVGILGVRMMESPCMSSLNANMQADFFFITTAFILFEAACQAVRRPSGTCSTMCKVWATYLGALAMFVAAQAVCFPLSMLLDNWYLNKGRPHIIDSGLHWPGVEGGAIM